MTFDYGCSLESTDHVQIAKTYGLFVGGRFVPAASGRSQPTTNPATETPLCDVAVGDGDDVDRAVRAARTAYTKVWRRMPPRERAGYLFRIARLIQEHAREFACLETLDGGMPIRETRDVDVPLAAAHLSWHAGFADKLELAFGGVRPTAFGVVGVVISNGASLHAAAARIAPALACGNTVVCKPAASTPLAALRLAEIVQQADLPAGVVNVVTGGAESGAALVQHRDVDMVAFRGSPEIGKSIQRSLACTGRALTLALGGTGVQIVFEDAALDAAVEGAVRGAFRHRGHGVGGGGRVLVQEGVHDAFVVRLRERIARIRVGDPLDRNTDLGAVPSREHLARIEACVRAGVDDGATLHQPDCELPTRGFWCRPTLFTGVAQSHRLAREAIVGPVLAVTTFRTADEAVQKANNTNHGASVGVFTDKGAQSQWCAQRLRAGVVWINTSDRLDPASPFGGVRESGFGREGGIVGLRAYARHDGAPRHA